MSEYLQTRSAKRSLRVCELKSPELPNEVYSKWRGFIFAESGSVVWSLECDSCYWLQAAPSVNMGFTS